MGNLHGSSSTAPQLYGNLISIVWKELIKEYHLQSIQTNSAYRSGYNEHVYMMLIIYLNSWHFKATKENIYGWINILLA